MFKKMTKRLNENAVLQFWFSYMLVFLLVLFVCIMGFARAFDIVKEGGIEENEHLFKQGINETENMIEDLYIAGMQLSLSQSLQRLGTFKSPKDEMYYQAARTVLDEHSSMLKYYDTEMAANMFIYVNNLDRVVYSRAVYKKNVFKTYPDKWGVSMEELEGINGDGRVTPHFSATNSGQLFYVFPFLQSMQNKEKLGTVFFRVRDMKIQGYMSFLENYSKYSLFIHQDGQILWEKDGLECEALMKSEWMENPGEYELGEKLVLSMSPEKRSGLSYTLVLPEQEAMLKLQRLRVFMWLLIASAAVMGSAFAFFFSFRSGRPINKIAQTLQSRSPEQYSTSLRNISESVSRIVEEQKRDLPALRNTFFHNLLKADFVSRTEMEYMATRAELSLTGTSYYAAAIRLFPQIDVNSIDGQTVEEARVLLGLVQEYLTENCKWNFWLYKRNTLIHLYIIECGDQEKLAKLLGQAAYWLGETYRADAKWGIGTLCDDLMQFWKSTEEANAVVELEDLNLPVVMYSTDLIPDDSSYYLPYSVEERLVQTLRAADLLAAKDTLEVIRAENFERRSLSRRQFFKLYNRIIESISSCTESLENNDEEFVKISSIKPENIGDPNVHFAFLSEVCTEACRRVSGQRKQQRGRKINAVISFIEENYDDPNMSLGLVSGKFNLSEGYLSSIFKSEVTVNFADYLEKIRIDSAGKLLNQGVLVTEVARLTGYNSVQSFRRAFKRVKGLSPSEYRVRE